MPAFNEAENIGPMADALCADVFPKIPNVDMQLLVVDANSPDGTAKIVKEKQDKYQNLHLLAKDKGGLGADYVAGFKYATEKLDADAVMEMDADFQHDPADVLRMVQEIDNGADYVIGSRFTKGGSIPQNWALYRKLLSVGGNLFSKAVLGIFSVNDFTTGFKASRVHGFVDKIDLDDVLSQGFAYKMDLLHKMYKAGAKIREIPIVFGMRDRGDSKMERNNPIESLKVVLTISVRENKSFIKKALEHTFVPITNTNISKINDICNLFIN